MLLQTRQNDCAAACLTMILGAHGQDIDLQDVRDKLSICEDGTSGLKIVEVARQYGLKAKGLRASAKTLGHLPLPAIIHWRFNHFVVFVSSEKWGARIIDPARGERRITKKELETAFTGVVIVCKPGMRIRRAKSAT